VIGGIVARSGEGHRIKVAVSPRRPSPGDNPQLEFARATCIWIVDATVNVNLRLASNARRAGRATTANAMRCLSRLQRAPDPSSALCPRAVPLGRGGGDVDYRRTRLAPTNNVLPTGTEQKPTSWLRYERMTG